MLESEIVRALTSLYLSIRKAETTHNSACVTFTSKLSGVEITIRTKLQKPYAVVFIEDSNHSPSGALPISESLFWLISSIASEWENGFKETTRKDYMRACRILKQAGA